MDKIKLSKNCKKILYQLHKRKQELLYREEYYLDIKFLVSNGLIKAHEYQNHYYSDLILTDKGEIYLYENPTLNNPTIWDDKKYWITTLISIIAVIISIIALCKSINNG
jgi:hypothetical protein